MSMADLVAAGAPELPSGYFYRVRPVHITAGFFVDVRRQRRFFGSDQVGASVAYPSDHESGTAAIVDGCRRAFERWQENERVRSSSAEACQFIGDHDPKGGR